jgi:hypothetical protein
MPRRDSPSPAAKRSRLLTILWLISAMTPASATAAEGFLTLLEDLPLTPGLTEDVDKGLSFDSAGGRIIEAYASGRVSEAQVLEFYEETLPQLGWTVESRTQFHRSGERLRIELMRGDGEITVQYLLSPQ